jgi:hypothetical protein
MVRRRLAGAALVALAITGLGGASGALGAAPAESGGSFPTILLQGSGWRVQHENMERGREGIEGAVEFVIGKPIPYEAIKISGPNQHRASRGCSPPPCASAGSNSAGGTKTSPRRSRANARPSTRTGRNGSNCPSSGRPPRVDTRAEFFSNQGGPGNRQMTAFLEDGGGLLEVRTAVPDQTAFEERVSWLTEVDEPTWLAAMPATVVIPAQHERTATATT